MSEGKTRGRSKEIWQFASAMAAIFAIFGVYRLYVRDWQPDVVATTSLAVSALWLTAFWLFPASISFLYPYWRRVASAIGFVASRMVLILLYILVMTPTSFLMRLVGTDPLRARRRSSKASSYWLQRETRNLSDHYALLWSEAQFREAGTRRPWRLRWVGLTASVAMLLVVLAVFVEAGTRIARSLYLDGGAITLLRSSPNAIVDPQLGWRSPSDEVVAYRRKCYGEARATYTKSGLRVWPPGELGQRRPGETRICVLGDSITQAYQLSDGLPYYHRLQALLRDDGLDVTMLGAGVGGYGTLQQILMFGGACRELAPDLVLWQFSDNDLINNSYRLERWSGRDNNFRPRPYLEDGAVQTRHPAPVPLPLDSLAMRILNGVVLRFSTTPGIEARERAASLNATREVLQGFLANSPPVIAFFADESPAFEALVQELNIVNVGRMAFEDDVENCRSAGDGHPNRAGHRKMAAYLHGPLRNMVRDLDTPPP